MIQKPSKKFTHIAILVLLVVGVTFFANTPIGKKVFTGKKTTLQPLLPKNQTLGELIGADQNKNGIADWEERLWGLDPSVTSTNGVSNKDIVIQNRAAAKANNISSSTNATDTLSYNIYATAGILNTSGDIDQNTLAGVVVPLVKQSVKQIAKKSYTTNDVLLVPSTTQNIEKYTKAIQNTVANASFGQNEIAVLSDALQNDDYSKLGTLAQSGASYQSFAKKIVEIRVPVVFARVHLDFANSVQAVGDTLVAAANIQDDAVAGATAIGEYSNESTVLNTSMENLTQTIQEYATLQAQ